MAMGRLKLVLVAGIAAICLGLASCGGAGGSSNQPPASPSTSGHGSGWA